MDKVSIIKNDDYQCHKDYYSDAIDEITSEVSNKVIDSKIPDYLQKTYWWAYIHPKGVKFFERQWLVNLILWGNYAKLRDQALKALNFEGNHKSLQIACVYGDFTSKLLNQTKNNSTLDVIDVAPIQLRNLKNKLANVIPAEKRKLTIKLQNAAALEFSDNSYDSVVLFFLLHELPENIRIKVVNEAFRVLAPGGKLVFIDYHNPDVFNPFRYIMIPILKWLEPFALDMWNNDITDWLSLGQTNCHKTDLFKTEKKTYFAGLYQKVVLTKI